IIPRLDSYAASQTLIGIDEKLRELDYQMIISNTSQDLEREIENIYHLAKQKVAGIILLATEITTSHLEAFQKVNIPVILVGQQHDRFHSVIHNDYEAAYELGRYILNKGHRKIAYLGVTEKDIAVGIKRKEGFKRAVNEEPNCRVRFFETSFKIEDSIKKVPEIINEFHPTVIVCATDNIALGALKSAHMMGLRIPEDLSISGFGGYDVTGLTYPGITTAKFYYREAGNQAATNMVRLVNEEELDQLTISTYNIIERESVDSKV
ncbi:MAG TPA: trehalose repressor, partial [Chondromyces sp.]|nr:trehalose repressor [Chondromyces sp.]